MSNTKVNIVHHRKTRGWSQEKLALISGLSERTIQRIEKDGNCSLESKLALASAFEIAPTELTAEEAITENDVRYIIDWGGIVGLFLLGLAIPLIILMTGTYGKWELVSFFTVIGLTVTISIMSYGFRQTYQLFESTSWIVKYPSYASGLNNMIIHANSILSNCYIVGFITSIVTASTLAIHQPDLLIYSLPTYGVIVIKPLLYSMLFCEFWFRPYKRKMERMLKEQQDN